MPKPERILIIKPSSLGDVATTLPMLCDLRQNFPAAMIDWLIHPAFAPLLEGHDAIHELIPFDRKKLGAWWYKPSAFGLFRALIKQLRGNRYDTVIDAQGLLRSGFLARITGAAMRIGFSNAREGATLMYTHKVHLPGGGRNMLAVDRMRALLGPLKIDVSAPAQFRMPVALAAIDAAQKLLRAGGLDDRRPFVAIIPGARWNTKRWDIERYAQVARRLLEVGEFVALLGSPDEKPLCDQIANALAMEATAGAGLANLAGKTSLGEMIAILAKARLVIGNDSGPLHVAVALGRPTLSIYGPTSPAFVGPFGQLQNVIRHDVHCHPCRRKECGHHSCMQGVSVELVWEKAKTLLPAKENAGAAP
jgi:heptosyltransferase-1